MFFNKSSAYPCPSFHEAHFKEFMQTLIKHERITYTKAYNFTFRNIDDACQLIIQTIPTGLH